jgi:hypothetical protein
LKWAQETTRIFSRLSLDDHQTWRSLPPFLMPLNQTTKVFCFRQCMELWSTILSLLLSCSSKGNWTPANNPPSIPVSHPSSVAIGALEAFGSLGRANQGYANTRSEPSRFELPGTNAAMRPNLLGHGYGGGPFEPGTRSTRMGAANYGHGAPSNRVFGLDAPYSRPAKLPASAFARPSRTASSRFPQY